MATLPSVQNQAAIENKLLELIRVRAIAAGYEYISTLIEERVHQTGPEWLREAQVIRLIDNYLRSSIPFVYLHVPLEPQRGPDSRVDIESPQRRAS